MSPCFVHEGLACPAGSNNDACKLKQYIFTSRLPLAQPAEWGTNQPSDHHVVSVMLDPRASVDAELTLLCGAISTFNLSLLPHKVCSPCKIGCTSSA